METTAPIPSPEASILGTVDDAEELTKLDPNYVTALRLTAMLTLVPLMIGALVIEATFGEDFGLPTGVIAGPVLLLGLFWIIRVPARRYAARGYQISADRLRVVRGILWRSDTIVPFGRVQHIDVDQGPIERFFDIATLTVHTAGNHNASVHLPGLNHDLAKDMREEMRAHIKQESM
ncbi:MAG: PH domain-containing protein [Pseudomonadota bacterium]